VSAGGGVLRGGAALPLGGAVTSGETRQALLALRAYGAQADALPPEAGRPAAEALGLAEDLINAGHGDPAGMIRILRELMSEDWRAVLAGRFTTGG